jgi:hypothetical protein
MSNLLRFMSNEISPFGHDEPVRDLPFAALLGVANVWKFPLSELYRTGRTAEMPSVRFFYPDLACRFFSFPCIAFGSAATTFDL